MRTPPRVMACLLVVVVASTLGLAVVVRAGDDERPDLRNGNGNARRGAIASDPRAAGTVTPPAPPFAVGITKLTVIDSSRPTPARGPTPASVERSLDVSVRFPVPGPPQPTDITGVSARRGNFPLVVFAHGFALTDATYPQFLHDLAAEGFVVVVPEFPLSSSALAGPSVSDPVEQAADVSFVVSTFLDPAARPAQLGPLQLSDRVAIVGHSDGGITAAGVAGSACCADPRVGAVVVLSGALARFEGPWFASASPPLLAVHGDSDEVNPISSSRGVYAAARAPKMLVAVRGGNHIGAFEDAGSRPAVIRLVADFLRAFVTGDVQASARLDLDAQVDGTLDLVASER